MLQGRCLCKFSLLIVLLIAFSAYGSHDYLGLYAKAKEVDTFFTEGSRVCSSGKIYRKEIKNDQTQYYVKDSFSNNSFIFKSNSDSIPLNSLIKIEGKVLHFSEPTNQGEFDLKQYYNSIGVYYQLDEVEIKDIKSCGFIDYEFFFQLRSAINRIYNQVLPYEEAGFLSSITVGEKSDLNRDLQSLFQNVGLAHVLAVSGLHVSIICMALYKLLRRFGTSFICSGAGSGFVAVCYCLLSGCSLSSLRAVGMFLIYLLAQVLGESYDMMTAASVMAVLLLLENPLYITNVSFIMTFGAVIGIYFVALPLSKCYVKRNPMYDYIVQTLIFSFGINIAMIPIVATLYHEIPTYSIFLNLFILPAMPFLLGIGLLGGFIGIFSIGAGAVILTPCHFIIYYMEMLSDKFLKLPGSRMIIGAHSFFFIVIYYLIVVMIMKLSKKIIIKFIILILIYSLWFVPCHNKFEIDFLDVGQGDGIFISSGDGACFFIDGGSTSKKNIGKYTIEPFLKYKGVRSIDYWFLSHMDEDHVSGVIELLESGYSIDNIVVTSEIIKDETFERIVSLAENNGTKIMYMKEGDKCHTNHLSFECVYPFEGTINDDINALSLSLKMTIDEDLDGKTDFSAFFGGDIGIDQERLIAEFGDIGEIDLLKVSHHGSRFSSDKYFLETLSPKISVISCAKKNRYGHPSDEAIERLNNVNTYIFYTMNSGQISVGIDGIQEFGNNLNNH